MIRIITLLLTLISFHSFAAPKSELWSFWQQSNQSDTTAISHQDWQSFLDSYLVKNGDNTLVKYGSVSSQDKQKLNRYITSLAAIDPREYSLNEQYAYWVNLYNAITVDLILDDYPVKSITKLGGLFSFGPWDDEVVTVAGKKLTLNDIEHRILRPIWNDPRTHYAVNCASLGCPNLQTQAFTADNTEQLLEQAAKEFINSDKGVLQLKGKTQLSSIYDWFAEDFGNKQELIQHLAKYRSELANLSGKFSYEYDWDLNEKE
ncbi:DUF547 domain-containing protein [Vibrio europaeus]|uniref:DUF547 domain-containing protein n=1 Tax=Vibrio europaeus TaxID=300876 RepID=UPI00233ECE96|nr:DUF547 domain-containing protein [Vibrio europaeus]MDC5807779.1 DUF547 domain-containing protein [Vibrio europaeus]MDC5824421.1 DUF547 domain-containing protein [Vibrio europaeus]MDC5828043.1 DUF547 domain-containing protein [Vibrio europaeus]MDC5836170.1 DUF547 domain-containing protein [Vibrio europaeus]